MTLNSSFCLRSEEFEVHVWSPNFQDLYLRDRFQKHLDLIAHKPHKATANWEINLKGLYGLTVTNAPGHSAETAGEKCVQSFCESAYLLILKASAEVQASDLTYIYEPNEIF